MNDKTRNSIKKKTILIIDDDLSVRFALKGVLSFFLKESYKLSIFTTGDGVEGLGHLFVDVPDLLIIDLTLPKYDGLEILDYIETNKELMHQKKLPIIVIVQDHLAYKVKPNHQNITVLHKSEFDFSYQLVLATEKALSGKSKLSLTFFENESLQVFSLSDKLISSSDASDIAFYKSTQKGSFLSSLGNRLYFLFLQIIVGNLLVLFSFLTNKHQQDENIQQKKKDLALFRVKVLPTVAPTIAALIVICIPIALFTATFIGTLWVSIFPTSSYTSINTTTSVTILNMSPEFSVAPAENPESIATAPSNVGTYLNFRATATDPNGDSYYLAVCRTNSITAVNGSAPTCAASQQLCVSGSTATATQASCNYQSLSSDAEAVTWYAFACDYAATSTCSASSQGTGNSGSPFSVNHAPTFTALTPSAAAYTGQDITFTSTASDPDTAGTSDTVSLVVCAVAGATSAGCTSVGNQLCASSSVASNPTCAYTIPAGTASGSHNYFAYIFDQHGFTSSSNPRTGTYSVENSQPVLSNLLLNSGNPINLAVSQTTNVPFTFTVTDNNGYNTMDTGITNFKLYRTSVGAAAADNSNNHYTVTTTACTLTPVTATSRNYSCVFPVQYHADPTDVVNTQFETDTWTATATVVDVGALQDSASATPVEMNSLLGIDSTAPTVAYGNLLQGMDSGSTNTTLVIRSVGNTGLDTFLKGTDMSNGTGGIIPVSNQKYDLAAFTYGTGGTALSLTDTLLALHVTKTTVSATPANKLIYWGIAVPNNVGSGNFTGTNTVTAQVSSQTVW